MCERRPYLYGITSKTTHHWILIIIMGEKSWLGSWFSAKGVDEEKKFNIKLFLDIKILIKHIDQLDRLVYITILHHSGKK